MKKIAIITIFDENNYGNRLQNFATQEILKEHGFKVSTLPNTAYYNNQINLFKYYLKKIINQLSYCFFKKNKRLKNFKAFDKKYIETGKFIHIKNTYKIVDRYDYFICGSDQIWNPYFSRLSPIDLLTFSPKEKNIALAASFGVSQLEDQHKKICKDALSNFKAISVRENQAKNIIHDIGFSNCTVLIDPTMMIDYDKWCSIEAKPSYLKKDFLVVYYLGEISETRKTFINKISHDNDLDIIYLCDINFPQYYNSGPDEFIYLVHHAKLVITDSFHACVFSILFKTPFYVFEREDDNVKMNSRIETLLSTFDLKDRLIKSYDSYDLEVDYSNIDLILNNERNKFNNFLDTSLY